MGPLSGLNTGGTMKKYITLISLVLAGGLAVSGCESPRNPANPVPQEQPPTVNGDATPPASSDASAELARGDSPAGASMQSTGKAVDDTWITTKTKTALLAEPELKAGSIQVETHDGVVALTGKVPSAEHSKKATMVARGIEGVTDVDNKLTVTQ